MVQNSNNMEPYTPLYFFHQASWECVNPEEDESNYEICFLPQDFRERSQKNGFLPVAWDSSYF